MENEVMELFQENEKKWNELYKRSENEDRPVLEIDSVPNHEDWNDSILDYDYIVDYVKDSDKMVLDIGTGNGAILGLLCKEYPHLSGVGFDVSDEAVSIGYYMLDKFSLLDRVKLLQNDMHKEWNIEKKNQFDIVMGNFSLQFNTIDSFKDILFQIKQCLNKDGRFIFKVRSNSRSVPDTYKEFPQEKNTYISGEEHEFNMIYHHYTKEDIYMAADILGGEIIHMKEDIRRREHDKYPIRAWWEVVIQKKG